jgi:type I restriction enzyme S subunit
MELKLGYKQTEVGVIPEEWEVSKVGREFEIQLGKMLDSEKNTGINKPYIGNKAVQWGRIDTNDLPTVPMSRLDLERFRLRRGDLLVCEGGEIGRAAIWEAQLDECFYQKALHRLRPLRGFNIDLMVAYLRYWTEHGMLSDYVSQTSIAHLTREKFAEVPLPVPRPEEQRAIAGALSDVDALIGALDKLIAKKRDIKQAAMQQLLTGKKPLPGFETANGKYKQTEVGVIPEDWEIKPLADLFSFSGGFSASRDQLSSEGHCYLHYGDIHKSSKTFVDVRAEYLEIPKLDVPLRRVASCSLLTDGDVVFVDASEDDEGTSRHVVVINQENIPYISGLHTIAAKSKTAELDNRYKRFCFQSRDIKRQFYFYAVGTKVSGISKTNIRKIFLPIPPLPEQRAVASVLSDMDAEIGALEQRRDKTRALKQGMMQELLTGKTRLI